MSLTTADSALSSPRLQSLSLTPSPPSQHPCKARLITFMEQISALNGGKLTSELLRHSQLAIDEIDQKSEGKRYEAWECIFFGFCLCFKDALHQIPKVSESQVEVFHAVAKICEQFVEDYNGLYNNSKELYEKLDQREKNYLGQFILQHTALLQGIKQFRIISSLSPHLQARITRIIARNFANPVDESRDESLFNWDPNAKGAGRAREYNEQLTQLFGSRFTNLAFLGSGASRKTYLAYEEATKKVVAIAIGKFSSKFLYNPAEKELLQELSGKPGIIETYEVKELEIIEHHERKVLQGIVQEFMDGECGEMLVHPLLKEPPAIELTAADLQKITFDVFAALETLEQHQVVHRDVRRENFLYRLDENGPIVKLIDFGLGQHITDKIEPLLWIVDCLDKAPEEFKEHADNKFFTSKLDVYSAGFMLYQLHWKQIWEMLDPQTREADGQRLKRLLETYEKKHIYTLRNHPEWFPNKPLPENTKGTMAEVIWHMLQKQPSKRYSVQQALDAAKKVYSQQL